MEAPVDSMHARRKPLKDRRPEGDMQGFSLPLPSRMTHMAPWTPTARRKWSIGHGENTAWMKPLFLGWVMLVNRERPDRRTPRECAPWLA